MRTLSVSPRAAGDWQDARRFTRVLPHALQVALPLAAVAALGAFTAFFRLGSRGLWGDEVWELAWSRQQPLSEAIHRFGAPPDLPLQFMLTNLATRADTSEFFTRLPAALLGFGTVVVLFLLARCVYGTADGLIAAALLAVAPYHVWYAQDARPYAGLAFYSTLSLYFLVLLGRRPTVAGTVGFAVAVALGVYNHLFGILPLGVELGAAATWILSLWYQPFLDEGTPRVGKGAALRRMQERRRQERAASRRRAARFGLAVMSGCAGALLLCWPLVPGIVTYIRAGNSSGGAPLVTAQFVHSVLAQLSAGDGWPFWLMATLVLAGTAASILDRQWLGVLGAAWLAFPFVLLWASNPGHPFTIRYLLFLQPVWMLLSAHGIVRLGAGAESLLRGRPGGLPRVREGTIVAGLVLVLVGALTVAMVPPTWQSYRVGKANNWTGMCQFLRRHVHPGDVITGNAWFEGAVSQYCWTSLFFHPPQYPAIGVSIIPTDNWPLESLTKSGRNVWYIMIGPAPEQAYLASSFYRIPQRDWNRPDLPFVQSYGSQIVYPQSEPASTLYFHAMELAPQTVQFHDVRSVSGGWPDYAQISPGDPYRLNLRLAAGRPRVLRLTYVTTTGYRVFINGRTIRTIRPPADSGVQWRSADVAVPPGAGDTVSVGFQSTSPQLGGVSSAGLGYMAGSS